MESIPTVIKSLQPIAFGSNQHVSYSITRHLLKLRLDKLKFHFSIWLYGQVKTHLIKSTHFYITVLDRSTRSDSITHQYIEIKKFHNLIDGAFIGLFQILVPFERTAFYMMSAYMSDYNWRWSRKYRMK